MTVFEYKVDSSQAFGAAALEMKLNAAGNDRWELIVADDTGILIYKRSDGSSSFKYKVSNPPAILQPVDLQAFLQPLGAQGWEVVTISTAANVIIFKQAT